MKHLVITAGLLLLTSSGFAANTLLTCDGGKMDIQQYASDSGTPLYRLDIYDAGVKKYFAAFGVNGTVPSKNLIFDGIANTPIRPGGFFSPNLRAPAFGAWIYAQGNTVVVMAQNKDRHDVANWVFRNCHQ